MITIPRISLGLLAATGLVLTTAFSTSAAVIASYEFTANTLTPAAELPEITASVISGSSNLTLFESTTTNTRTLPDALFSGGNDGVLQARSGGTLTKQAAIDAGMYFELTINVTTGFEVDFTNITFNAGSSGSSGAPHFSLYGDYGSGFEHLGDSGALTSSAITPANIDLSALSGITNSVVFRFYVVDAFSGTTRTLAIDDIVFNGTITAIPEPQGAALVIVGLAFMVCLTRRKNRRAVTFQGNAHI